MAPVDVNFHGNKRPLCPDKFTGNSGKKLAAVEEANGTGMTPGEQHPVSGKHFL
jgi:hypothetical protein